MSISSYSLHRSIHKKEITMLDFVRIAAERYGVGVVELNSPFFLLDEPGYMNQLQGALDEYGIVVHNIAVDRGNVAAQDGAEREESVSKNSSWLDVAREIGCPSIRVNAGHSDDLEEGLKRSIASFKVIVEKARELGLSVLMENHGGFSSDPDGIMTYVRELGTENFGTCPDFGNFTEEIRYEALEAIAPYAKFIHAKTYAFDADGNETTLDIPRIIRIFEDAGYDGDVSVEYEGPTDEYEGIEATVALLKRCGVEI
jgi:sugar phosphate isomerase/epimerase